jgi:prepilin-type N-terminal cleavage/methylation domain-containing protein/prepilin-type processing-associated H-X9-DG protein
MGDAARARGFTLIEVLATAAIIAVLASITLASINSFKTNADRTVCVANMRTIAAAILTYTADNNGTYPTPFGDGTVVSWDGLILPYLKDNATTTQRLTVLVCPEDKRGVQTYQSKPVYPRSYKLSSQPANQKDSPMGVAGYWDEDGKTVGMGRRVVQVTKPADTILLFENFTTNAQQPNYVDNWQFRSGSSVGSGWNSARVTGYRPDGSKKLYHGKTINYAMADGRVESQNL